MKKILISLLVLIGISMSALTQEKSSKEKKGDKYFFIYAYDDAINRYSQTNDLTVSGQRNLAESYRYMNQNEKSEETYQKLISEGNAILPEDYYNYSMLLKHKGKYTDSDVQMKKFSDLKPNDLRAISFRENQHLFSTILNDSGDYEVKEMSINTASQDFGTAFFKGQIVYASSNASPKMIKRRDNRNNEPYFNLYVANIEESELEDRKFFDKKDNGKMHDGPASFNEKGTFMAFTKNNDKDKAKENTIQLQIYTRVFENDKWSEPLAFTHNNSAYSVGHAHLSADGRTMYFVSDMPGGFGGSDIYRSVKTSTDSWGAPENLGNVINTEGDEMFPFYDESNNILHFASDGHFGLGGLDIFSSSKNGVNWGTVINQGAPLNTRFDDYAMIINNETKTGYFSSNREGGSGMDDIYGVTVLKMISTTTLIAGTARNEAGEPLSGTTVKLFDDIENELGVVTTGMDGTYEFVGDKNKNYVLIGNKTDFLEGRNTMHTFGNEDEIKADVTLLQEETEEEVVIVDEDVFVEEDLAVRVKLKPIYFAFDKSDISANAAKELDKMVKVMNQFPNMHIELKSYTDCRGTKEYNNALSQRRAQSSADYIKARISAPSRIEGKGYGESKLTNDCVCEEEESTCSDAEHKMNRRTEFIVKKK